MSGGEGWLCVRDGWICSFFYIFFRRKHIWARISCDGSVRVPPPPSHTGTAWLKGRCVSFTPRHLLNPPPHPRHAFPERRVEPGWSLKEREG